MRKEKKLDWIKLIIRPYDGLEIEFEPCCSSGLFGAELADGWSY